ncbi:hypothetical protein VTL71DRAFT_1445 [Oculimacula yallundae]|uniref:Uncharacterized protein n=1 Tax=Oculimacula yallundae TaxID=86028 RepID=A0ABR4CCM0_9HELO
MNAARPVLQAAAPTRSTPKLKPACVDYAIQIHPRSTPTRSKVSKQAGIHPTNHPSMPSNPDPIVHLSPKILRHITIPPFRK